MNRRKWNREVLAAVVRTRAFWIRYGLGLSQALVVVAYFLPWHRGSYDGGPYSVELLEYAYDVFNSSRYTPWNVAFFWIALLACFLAAIFAYLLTIFVLTKKGDHALALCASSTLTSLALAGPLLYAHQLVPWPGESAVWFIYLYTHVSTAELTIGWYVALLSGATACLLTLKLYHEACESSKSECDSGEGLPRVTRMAALTLVPVLLIAVGCVITMVGFFTTWSSGSIYYHGHCHFWFSNYGFEVSPMMHIVPVASIISSALVILGAFIREMRSPVFVQAAQNLMTLAFTLTLLWGPAFGKFEILRYIDVGWVAELQLGWYLCVIGQAIALGFIFLLHRYWLGAWDDSESLRSENNSRLPSQ